MRVRESFLHDMCFRCHAYGNGCEGKVYTQRSCPTNDIEALDEFNEMVRQRRAKLGIKFGNGE